MLREQVEYRSGVAGREDFIDFLEQFIPTIPGVIRIERTSLYGLRYFCESLEVKNQVPELCAEAWHNRNA